MTTATCTTAGRLDRYAAALANVIAEARAFAADHPADCDCDLELDCASLRRAGAALQFVAEQAANIIACTSSRGEEGKLVAQAALGAGALPADLSYAFGGPGDGGSLELARVPLALAEQLEGERRLFVVWPRPEVHLADDCATEYRCRSADGITRAVSFRGPGPQFDDSAPLLVEGTLAVEEYEPSKQLWSETEIIIIDAVPVPHAEQSRRLEAHLAHLPADKPTVR
jgi:hypothetical protein